MSGWTGEDDRTYHGIEGDDGVCRIYVESSEYGPTEREIAEQKGRLLIRELHTPDEEHGAGFGWGYNGGGTSRTAAAVLADALNEPQERYDSARDELTTRFREDFCEDVLAQFCPEWRLSRGAVLRWARGWYAQQGLTPISKVLITLPPIGRDFFGQL